MLFWIVQCSVSHTIKRSTSKRGLYLNLDEDLPCTVDKDEDSLIEHILHTDYNEACLLTKKFHERFAPHAGNASEIIVNEILLRLTNRKL